MTLSSLFNLTTKPQKLLIPKSFKSTKQKPNQPSYSSLSSSINITWVIKVISTLSITSKAAKPFSFLSHFTQILTHNSNKINTTKSKSKNNNSYGSLYIVNNVISNVIKHNPSIALSLHTHIRRKYNPHFVLPNDAYYCLIKSLCERGMHEEASEVVFGDNGVLRDVYVKGNVLGYLIKSCARAGKFNVAKQLVVRSLVDNVGVANGAVECLVKELCQKGMHDEVEVLFENARKTGVVMDGNVVTYLIEECVRMEKFDVAKELIVKGLDSNGRIETAALSHLVKVLCEKGMHNDAREVVLGGSTLTPDGNVLGYLIKFCMRTGKFDIAKELIVMGLDSNVRIGKATFKHMVKSLCEKGMNEEIMKILFDNRVVVDSDILGYLIKWCAREGNIDVAVGFVYRGRDCGIGIGADTYECLVKSHCERGMHDEAKEIVLGDYGVVVNGNVLGYLINSFVKMGKFDRAKELIGRGRDANVGIQADTYECLVKCFCEKGMHNEAKDVLFNGIVPSSCILEYLIKSCVNNGKFEIAKDLVVRASDSNVVIDAATYECLFMSLCEKGLHNEAYNLIFDDGAAPDSFTLGYLISSCAREGKFDIARGLVVKGLDGNVRIVATTFNNLLNCMVKKNYVSEVVSFLKEMILGLEAESGSLVDTCSFNIVINGLCKARNVRKSLEVFESMNKYGCCPDVFTYNTLIDGLCRSNEVDKAQGLLNEIKLKSGVSPDVVTFTSVISGYCGFFRMNEASVVFAQMIVSGIRPNLITYNVMIDGYGKGGNMLSALQIFEGMEVCVPDVVTFSSLIDGHCRVGEVDKGLKLLHEMDRRRIQQNAYTFTILIHALCKRNRLKEARELLRQLKSKDIVPKAFMYNPVIDGYCKSGNVSEANMIVTEMEGKKCMPNKYTLNILIIGHCMKGRMFEAISIFHKMLDNGCGVDAVIVNSLISCLLKAGMPKEVNAIVIAISQKDLNLGLFCSNKIRSLVEHMQTPVAV